MNQIHRNKTNQWDSPSSKYLRKLKEQDSLISKQISELEIDLYRLQIGFLDLILVFFFWPFLIYVFYKMFRRSQLNKIRFQLFHTQKQLRDKIRRLS